MKKSIAALSLDTWEFQNQLPQARIYQNALPLKLFTEFQRWALEIHPTPVDRTIWFPLSKKPRFLPERVILHYLSLAGNLTRGCTGAEWWLGYRKPHEALHYHVDRDESLFKKQGITKVPELSTVFYLTSVGGPTFIPNDFIKRDTGKISRVPVTSFLKSFPKPNKLLIFGGNYFHSVLPGRKNPSHRKNDLRITFIVNFWKKRPTKPVCIDPDPSFILKSLPLDLNHQKYS